VRKISIFCCSKVTHKLGCSSTQCLYDMKNRTGLFERYSRDEGVELVGLVNCPGCPTQIAPDRIINQIVNLTEFDVEVIHFTNCMSTFCAYRHEYKSLIERNYPDIEVVLGTCKPHITKAQQEIVAGDICKN
jgi:predicted metal-binding protein